MYSFQASGCLVFLIVMLVVIFLVKKLWMLFVGIAAILIAVYYFKLLTDMYKEKQREKAVSYEPKNGEVYKVCPECNTKVKINVDTCPNCKHYIN